MTNPVSNDSNAGERRLTSSAWVLLILSAVGLWFPWCGFGYCLFEDGGFHRGLFVEGIGRFVGFLLASWIATPVFTLLYIVYGVSSSPRSASDQSAFVVQISIAGFLWLGLVVTVTV